MMNDPNVLAFVVQWKTVGTGLTSSAKQAYKSMAKHMQEGKQSGPPRWWGGGGKGQNYALDASGPQFFYLFL